MPLLSALNDVIPFVPPIVLKLSVPILAMLPFVEIGLAIPYGIAIAGLTPLQAALFALMGHVTIILILTPIIYKNGLPFEDKHILVKNFIEHVRKINLERFRGIRELGIVAFIALPLPVGGIWYAIPAAYIFKVSQKRTMISALVGSTLGAIQFTLLWTGILALLKFWLFSNIVHLELRIENVFNIFFQRLF